MNILKAMLLLFVLPHPAVAQTIDTMALRTHTRFLAADALKGRGAGTQEERIAAEYIASQLMRIRVQPANEKSYFQTVPLKRAKIADASLQLDGVPYGRSDFIWNTGGPTAFRPFGGPVLYVGAIDSIALRRAPEARGHVVVVNGTMGAAAQHYVPALIAAGATGVVMLVPDSMQFALFMRSRGDARYFIDADVREPVWQPELPVILAGPAISRRLIGRSRFMATGMRLQAQITATIEDVSSVNVVGIIPGKDARRASEIVAYSAHYDHLGVSTPDARGDSIYNGFSDNAAGVAMLLAIAEQMVRNPPARSVMFLFFTAEERGLLGSSYYAAHPLIPLQRMTALINLDAGAPPAPPVSWRIAGGLASTLGDLTKSVADVSNWSVNLTPASPNSDYWPFLQNHVPSVFIIPGNEWEGVTVNERALLQQRWDRYHRPDDEWNVNFPFSGMKRYAEFAYQVGRAAADAPAKSTMK